MTLPRLETPRLTIQPYNNSHLEIAYNLLYSQSEDMKFVGKGSLTKAEFRQQFQAIQKHYQEYGFGRLAIVEKISNLFIGDVGLYWSDRCSEAQLGYKLVKKSWGKGYATEAAFSCLNFGFQQLNIELVSAFVMPANIGSQKVLAKLGFAKKTDSFMYCGRTYFRYQLSQVQHLIPI